MAFSANDPDFEETREIALCACMHALKQLMEATGGEFETSSNIDMRALTAWYMQLPSEIKDKLATDDEFMRSVLGFEHFCMDIYNSKQS